VKFGLTMLIIGGIWASGGLIFEKLPAKMLSIYASLGFLVVGTGYLFQCPAVWLKRRYGTLHPVGWLLYLPLHVMNWLAFWLGVKASRSGACHEVAPNLWLGRRLIGSESRVVTDGGQCAVLDLTSEFAENPRLRNGHYLCLPTLDHTSPRREQIEEAIGFISGHIASKRVFVHCAMGHGRSACVAAAWLLHNGVVRSVREAEARLRAIRTGVVLKKDQICTLEKMFPN